MYTQKQIDNAKYEIERLDEMNQENREAVSKLTKNLEATIEACADVYSVSVDQYWLPIQKELEILRADIRIREHKIQADYATLREPHAKIIRYVNFGITE